MHTYYGNLVPVTVAARTSDDDSCSNSRVHVYAWPWSGLANPAFLEIRFGLWDILSSIVGYGQAVQN